MSATTCAYSKKLDDLIFALENEAQINNMKHS